MKRKNSSTPLSDEPLILATQLAARFSLSRCYPDGEGGIYIRYATGSSETLSVPEAQRLLQGSAS